MRAVLGLSLALATACGDDDDNGDDNGSTPDTGVRDAATPLDSAASLDSAVTDAARSDASTNTIIDVALADGRFKTLAAAVTRVGLTGTLQGAGPYTVFAPTDAAFAKLPPGTLEALTNEQLTGILTYHALAGEALSSSLKSGPVTTVAQLSAFVNVSGSTVKVNNANVTTADVQASNGVIHVIDTVLLPPNIAEMAGYAGFTQLVSAVQTANLGSALTDATAKLTVFAPTDAAFGLLPPGTVAGLTPTQLADVLKYHVLPTQVLSTALTAGPVNTLLTGKQVTISLTGGPKVNDANITVTDVKTTNGVIHAIDKVLLPPQ